MRLIGVRQTKCYSKSNAIFFSAQKKITASPLTMKDSEEANDNSVKLLGVTFDQHLRFSTHIDALIQRCRPAFHAIVKLRKAGVNDESLCKFYKSRVVPLLTYAAPCWFPQLSNKDIERLEKYQRLCLRVMLPNLADSNTRQAVSSVEDVNIRLSTLCFRYITKAQSDDDHPLHSYTTTVRSSEHSGRHIKSKSMPPCYPNHYFKDFHIATFNFIFMLLCVIIIHNYVQHGWANFSDKRLRFHAYTA